MERLSSCYFCGDAVDAPLESYPLVPDEHHPDVDTGREVVLCPTCRRKLTTVLEHVLAAVLGRADEAVPDDSTDILHDVDVGDPMIPDGVERIEGDRSGAGNGGPNDGPDRYDLVDSPGEDDDPWVTAGEAGSGTNEDPAAETTGTDAADETDGDATDGAEAGRVGPGGDDPDDADRDAGTEKTEASGGEGADAAGGSDDGPGQYSRSEYNRIVRLLQNRDFPVEIEEIAVVARNAYGIDEATCHAVLKALVERGVVADQGETLVKT